MLTQTAEYAMRAVLYLAEVGQKAVRVGQMSEALGIPASYLSKTLQALVRARILKSVRGRNGGFQLAVAPKDLPLVRVVTLFDPIVERRYCLLGRGKCSDATACAAHAAWKSTADQIAQFFRVTTFADIRGPVEMLALLPRTSPSSRRAV